MKPKTRESVPLPAFGVRKKISPRKKSKLLIPIRNMKEKPNAGRIYPVENKEEKHSPKETKDFSNISISKLRDMIGDLSEQELKDIAAKDQRITARKLASDELIDRGSEK